VILLAVLPALRAPAPFGIEWLGDRVALTDFASHFRFSQAFWNGNRLEGVSVYSVENHLHMTTEWSGRESTVALSFGYAPTMLLVLAPLVLFSAPLAYAIFNLLGVVAAMWQTRPGYSRAGWGLAAFFSPLAMACFVLGQTAILTGAALLYLFLRSDEGSEPRRGRHVPMAAGVLWALTAKPPLALTAGAVLLSLRHWRPVLVAVGLTTLTTAALSPFLGPGWVGDYLHMIGTYNTVEADPAFSFGFVPGHMTNLRAILGVDFGVADDLASRISSLVWLAGLGGLVAAGPRLRLGTGGTWAAGLLLFLLFSPHVSSTEVLQVALLVPFCVPVAGPLEWRRRLLFITAPLLPLLSPPFTGIRIPLFACMAATLVLVASMAEAEGEAAARTGTTH
jgi:hypothetical protein